MHDPTCLHDLYDLYDLQRLRQSAELRAQTMRTQAVGDVVATLAQWALRSAFHLARVAARMARAASQQRNTTRQRTKEQPCQPSC